MSIETATQENIVVGLKAAAAWRVRAVSALTWPNGADLDPSLVHEEISKNKTWSVPV